MLKGKVVAVVITSLTVLTLVSLGTTQVTNKLRERRLVPHAERQQPEKEDATPVQEGVMTAKQRAHSKLFKGYGAATGGKKIRDLVAERGDVDLRNEVGDVILPRSFSLHSYLQNLTCQADAVVVGTVTAKSSQVTADESFIFTDYELTADEVLKNNSGSPIQPGGGITVTRAGGAVKINGHVARATDFSQRPLQVGEHYVLFLRYIPATGGYMYVSNWGDDTFRILDNQVNQVSATPLPLGPGRTADATFFLNEIRGAAGSACAK